jgi:hypothetical protein
MAQERAVMMMIKKYLIVKQIYSILLEVSIKEIFWEGGEGTGKFRNMYFSSLDVVLVQLKPLICLTCKRHSSCM